MRPSLTSSRLSHALNAAAWIAGSFDAGRLASSSARSIVSAMVMRPVQLFAGAPAMMPWKSSG